MQMHQKVGGTTAETSTNTVGESLWALIYLQMCCENRRFDSITALVQHYASLLVEPGSFVVE